VKAKAMQQWNDCMTGDNIMSEIVSLTRYKMDRTGGMTHNINPLRQAQRFVITVGIRKLSLLKTVCLIVSLVEPFFVVIGIAEKIKVYWY
jgi:hypothetical protein